MSQQRDLTVTIHANPDALYEAAARLRMDEVTAAAQRAKEEIVTIAACGMTAAQVAAAFVAARQSARGIVWDDTAVRTAVKYLAPIHLT